MLGVTAHFSHLSSLSLPLPLPYKAAEQGCCRILALAAPAPDLQPCWGRHRPRPACLSQLLRPKARDTGQGNKKGGGEGEPPGRLGPGELLSGQAGSAEVGRGTAGPAAGCCSAFRRQDAGGSPFLGIPHTPIPLAAGAETHSPYLPPPAFRGSHRQAPSGESG